MRSGFLTWRQSTALARTRWTASTFAPNLSRRSATSAAVSPSARLASLARTSSGERAAASTSSRVPSTAPTLWLTDRVWQRVLREPLASLRRLLDRHRRALVASWSRYGPIAAVEVDDSRRRRHCVGGRESRAPDWASGVAGTMGARREGFLRSETPSLGRTIRRIVARSGSTPCRPLGGPLPHHRHSKSREAPRATTAPVPDGLNGHRTLSYGFLSSAPPTHCGLATFSAALGGGLVARGARVSIVRVRDEADHASSSSLPVIAELVAGDPESIDRTVRALNTCDVVVIQHEYGLFGGRDGADVLAVLDGLRVPVVATLHTVLPSPTDHQREVLDAVLDRVEAAVVMSDRAETILRRVNAVGDTPVVVIPHGAAVPSARESRAAHERPVLLTWGLLGPGKGIQWVIDALAGLKDLDPAPIYVIAGQTHPKVLALRGRRLPALAGRGASPSAAWATWSASTTRTSTSTRWASSSPARTRSSCPTTRRTRRRRGCSSTPSRPGARSSRPRSRTPSSSWARAPGSSSPTATSRRCATPSAGSSRTGASPRRSPPRRRASRRASAGTPSRASTRRSPTGCSTGSGPP